MTKYRIFTTLSIFYFIMGVFTTTLVDQHMSLLIIVLVAFYASFHYHDLAKDEWTIIKDNALMDRPE